MAARYRLTRPVSTLRRSSGALQVGLDAAASALVPDAPEDAEVAIGAFRTWRTLGEAALVSGVDQSWLSSAVALLVAGGVLTRTDPGAPSTPRRSVTVLGGGSLAHQLVGYLSDAGVGAFRVAETTPAVPEAHHWQAATGSAHLVIHEHWHEAVSEPTHLVVIAARTVEPDRAVTDHVRRAGFPHLVVRVEPERAVVGPFVVPGLSPCQRCIDLDRRDRDPDWPYLLAQLSRTWQRGGELATGWAASSAAAQCLGWLDRDAAPPLGTTLELPDDCLALETRTWRAHPQCGCVQDW